MDIKWIGANSKNYSIGRNGTIIKKIVLHWIVGKLAAADATFQDGNRIASAHYGIGGKVVHQYVKDTDTAYHAGNLTVNRESIGIEHEGGPDIPISEDTYKTSIALVTDLCKKYGIPVDRDHIKMHREIKATQCPGTLDIDRIVKEVQKNMSNKTVTLEELTFTTLVTKSTNRDELYDYLSVSRDPVETNIDKPKGVIEGYKNLATGLQRQLSEAQQEIKNRIEQVERVKQTYEASAKTDKEQIQALNTAQKAWIVERESLRGQIDTFATEKGAALNEAEVWKTKYNQAMAGQTQQLTIGDVISLLMAKLWPIRLK